MNPPIVRIYVLVLLLFAVLVGFTTRWTVFEAEELEEEPKNRRVLIETQQVERGTITTADGELVAESLPEGGGENAVYVRRYPQGSLYAHPVGYSFADVGATEFELEENDLLLGEENEFVSILDQVRDVTQEGEDVTLTINAQAQRTATDALESAIASTPGAAGKGGAVVAIEPDTGAVRVLASVPGYDPATAEDGVEDITELPGNVLLNRATQAGYPPGSTMKVVTATAALESGEFETSTVLNADSPKVIGGTELANSGGANFGDIDMVDALTNSVNTYWAQVGEQLGTETLYETMDRFGFNADPDINLPDVSMVPSGVFSGDELLGPGDPTDIGRVAIGQGALLATPLQMAQVAAAVANGGVLMRPTLLQEAKDADGRTTEELDPSEQSTVMSSETAASMVEMMTNVANEGTASGLSVGSAQLAGKTGTAEIDVAASINQPWFVGFAPAEDPQIAVAATIERCTGCFGGEVAGPIATQVMQVLLDAG